MQQRQNVENVPSLNSKGVRCNGKARHANQTPLQKCTVKLVDFRKTLTISEGNFHTGGNDDEKDDHGDI